MRALVLALVLIAGCAGVENRVEDVTDQGDAAVAAMADMLRATCNSAGRSAIHVCKGVEGSDRECFAQWLERIDAVCIPAGEAVYAYGNASATLRLAASAVESGAERDLGKAASDLYSAAQRAELAVRAVTELTNQITQSIARGAQ